MENKTSEMTYALSKEQLSELDSLMKELKSNVDEIKLIELNRDSLVLRNCFRMGITYSKILEIHKNMESLIDTIRIGTEKPPKQDNNNIPLSVYSELNTIIANLNK